MNVRLRTREKKVGHECEWEQEGGKEGDREGGREAGSTEHNHQNFFLFTWYSEEM